MQQALSILRHLGCIVRKVMRGQGWSWHWQHILREFGLGRYSETGQRRSAENS